MKAVVYVRIKPEVSDPAGMAIRDALAAHGYGPVKGVRAGKVFDLELEAAGEAEARREIERIAREVLSNPVVEEFECELLPEGGK